MTDKTHTGYMHKTREWWAAGKRRRVPATDNTLLNGKDNPVDSVTSPPYKNTSLCLCGEYCC